MTAAANLQLQPEPLRQHVRVAERDALIEQHALKTGNTLKALRPWVRSAGRLTLWDGTLLVQDGRWYHVRGSGKPVGL